MGAPEQPAFPHQNAHTILWVHCPSSCAQLEFRLSLWAPRIQLADTCLGMALNTARAKKYSSLSKRGSVEFGFICDTVLGNSWFPCAVSNALVSAPLPPRRAEASRQLYLTLGSREFPFWTQVSPSEWFLWQDLSYLTYMVFPYQRTSAWHFLCGFLSAAPLQVLPHCPSCPPGPRGISNLAALGGKICAGLL